MKTSNIEFVPKVPEASIKALENENKFLKAKVERQTRALDESYDVIKEKDSIIKALEERDSIKTTPNDQNKQLKEDKLILSQNDKIMSKFVKTKDKRHVKEPTEPVFKDILKEFSLNYGKLVVSNTSFEILNLVSKDDF